MFQPSLYARRRGVNGESGLLSEGKGAARGGDRTAEIFGGFDPFLDDDFDVGESFLVGLSIGGAAFPALAGWANVWRPYGACSEQDDGEAKSSRPFEAQAEPKP